jgi:hypothetical protein
MRFNVWPGKEAWNSRWTIPEKKTLQTLTGKYCLYYFETLNMSQVASGRVIKGSIPLPILTFLLKWTRNNNGFD